MNREQRRKLAKSKTSYEDRVNMMMKAYGGKSFKKGTSKKNMFTGMVKLLWKRIDEYYDKKDKSKH
jgi:hypothetical protein